jgi:CBS domain-containing protein
MQVREIMTTEVTAVVPETSVKFAGEVMAARGFAALPVVDGRRAVVGIVAEADVLRSRMPQDPRLHLRRPADSPAAPPLVVGQVMSTPVRTVMSTADVADLAHLFLDEGLRSVPVLDGDRLVGIVSRRDVLAALARPDDDIAREVRHLLTTYAGQRSGWAVDVREGVVALVGPVAVSDADTTVEADTVRTLALTVAGVVAVRLQPAPGPSGASELDDAVPAPPS